jgi:putative spermidine/putrescine transport system ATP-binding protein
MASVEVRGLCKRYGGIVALDDVSLTIASGEFVTLLGPSGSGKTTLLNSVSGMIHPTSGSILIDGGDVTHTPPRQRGLGMVFQNYALMPHMTVFLNVAFPLHVRKMARAEIGRRVLQALEIVRLSAFAGRRPKELSGGQQQRVAIARCLVYQPRVILMDEPLGALDKKLREQLQLEIKKIHKELGVTVLYVTHDQGEALTMSDRVCVMRSGRIEQTGTPDDLYFRPKSEFVADFIGESNLLPVVIADICGDTATVQTPESSTLKARIDGHMPPSTAVKMLVRPESVRMQRAQDGAEGVAGVVQDRIFNGQSIKYMVTVNAVTFAAQLKSSPDTSHFAAGEKVLMHWSPDDAFIVPNG